MGMFLYMCMSIYKYVCEYVHKYCTKRTHFCGHVDKNIGMV